MSIKKTLIKNTGFNLLGYVYLLVASFLSVPILLNSLGRDTFGVYIFLVSFIPLSAIFDFGVANAAVREFVLTQDSKVDRVRVWKTSFSIFIFLGLLLTAIFTTILIYSVQNMSIFRHLDLQSLNYSIVIISVIVFINLINSHFLSLPQAEQRFDIFNSKTFLVGTANTLISAAIARATQNIAAIFLVQSLFHLATLFYMVSYCHRFFSGSSFFPRYYKEIGTRLFSFGLRSFVGNLAGQIENQFSNFILGIMVSAKAVASFNIPQSIVIKGAGIISQFAQVFFPLSTSLLSHERIHKLKKLVFLTEGFAFGGGLIAVAISYFYGKSFLIWWLKDTVVADAAYPVLKVLSFYFLLIALTPVPTALVQGLNKPQISSFFAVLTVAIEICLGLTLTPIYGIVGTALSFSISAAITVPLFLIVSWRHLSQEIKKIQLRV